MSEHPPRNDRKKARETKRNGGGVPLGDAVIGAQETVMELALKKAQEAIREEGAGVSMGNEALDKDATIEVGSAETEKELGVALGEAFPVDKILEELKKNGGTPEPLKGKGNGNRKDLQNETAEVAQGETKIIPNELSEIFGDAPVSADVLRLHERLSKDKKEGYVDKLRDEITKKKKKLGSKKPSVSAEVKSAKRSVARRGLDIDLSEPVSDVEAGRDAFPTAQVLEAEEQRDIDKRIAATHTSGQSVDVETPGSLQQGVIAGPEQGIVLHPEDVPDYIQEALDRDQTPKEWRERLQGLISGAKEKIRGGERLRGYFAQRSSELDAEAEHMGGVEKLFRSLGERYDKLSFVKKLGLGVSLGVGAAAFSSVSIFAASAFTLGLGLQRIAGMASMYSKIEKSFHLEDKKGGKEMAMLMAGVYTIGMGYAIKEAVQYVSESPTGEAVHEWLRQHYPFSEASVSVTDAGTTEAAGVGTPPEVTQPAAAVEAAVPVAPEGSALASIEVKATPGHGYEYMMKRLWEQLHEKNIELPANANPDSDLARLLAADEDSIDKIVHQIAADPNHQFFHVDGSSVRIDPSAHMTIGARGELFLSDVGHEYQIAPAHAPVTGLPSVGPHVEGPAVTPESLDLYFGTQSGAHEINPLTGIPNEQLSAPVETAVPHEQLPAPVETTTPHPVEAATPRPEAPISSAAHSIVNSFGVEVQTLEPHLYADSTDHIFAYGGSPTEKMKMVLEYLTKNPDKIVYVSDDNGEHRIPWHLAAGKVVPAGAPVETRGFLGFFRDFMKAPSPDEFEKIIK